MLIGLTGPICGGKSTVAEYLVNHHGFEQLKITREDLKNPTATNALEFLKIVSNDWQKDFVIGPFDNLVDLEPFRKKPFFLLVAVDAPIFLRFTRAQSKGYSRTLEAFVQEDDRTMYRPSTSEETEPQIRPCMNGADVLLLNDGTLGTLEADIRHADLTNAERLRPSWDTYFMKMADLAARRSNCMKRRVGCVLVADNRVVATGYNGTAKNTKNCNQGGCKRCNSNAARAQGLDFCLCLHAEENALLEAGRSRANGAVLYCNTCPCLPCAKKIVQVGVKRVLYSQEYGMDELTKELFQEAGVEFQQLILLQSTNLHTRSPGPIVVDRSQSTTEFD